MKLHLQMKDEKEYESRITEVGGTESEPWKTVHVTTVVKWFSETSLNTLKITGALGYILKLYHVLICVLQILDEICHAHYRCSTDYFFLSQYCIKAWSL